MRIHERLLLLLRDPGLPRWCGWLIGVGFLIPGPLDELVIFTLVFFVVWVWRREVFVRHGFTGVQVLAAFVASSVVFAVVGLFVDILVKGGLL